MIEFFKVWFRHIIVLILFIFIAISHGEALLKIPEFLSNEINRNIMWAIVVILLYWELLMWKKKYTQKQEIKPMIELESIETDIHPISEVETEYDLMSSTSSPHPRGVKIDEEHEACFAYVVLTNKNRNANSTAIGTIANVRVYNHNFDELIQYYGRWGDVPPPSVIRRWETRRELKKADIESSGLSRRLNLLIKHPGEKVFYGFDIDSYDYLEFRNNNLKLPDGKYLIKIVFSAENMVEKVVWLSINSLVDGLQVSHVENQEIINLKKN